ncbi:MAG: ABC transporter substrate-binding protein [Spirochaetales bacterium]|nr:ABC transporter substrate-binding protein [Spirochaetales bacterium]
MKRLILIILALVLGGTLFAGGKAESWATSAEWEEWAGLGQFSPEEDDWDAIEAAAKEEGTLTVYSISSRVFEFARTFYKEYGIKVEASDLTTPALLEKLMREQEAGIFNADVVFVDDIPTVYNEFYYEGRLFPFVPSDLKDVIIDEALDAPLAIHHYGSRGIAYNTDYYSEPPIDSWWDLTRTEWKGKIIMKDPMNSGAEFNTFATFIQHHVDMEEAYQDEFGEELVKRDGIPNAGYEFLLRLMENELILMADSGSVMSAVASSGQSAPPLGILGFSKLRTIEEERMSADFIKDLTPVTGFRTTTIMAIGAFSSHPNAAKLMIKWMYGGDNPRESTAGYKPFHVIGNWAVRTDIAEPEGQKPLSEMNFYEEDGDWLYDNAIGVRDFWLENQ